MRKKLKSAANYSDVVLIGAGVMSATLGVLLKELQPDLKITIFERLDLIAGESSEAWNNAGTGHAALCELNYTPEKPDGSVDGSKALKIYDSFQLSRQFWSYLVEKNILSPEDFIQSVPHMSFVHGEKNVSYLRKRFDLLTQYHVFKDMVYTENPEEIKNWIPLVMEGRDENQPVAATYTDAGTDVNFGNLTRMLFDHLKNMDGVKIRLKHEVTDLEQLEDGNWCITLDNLATKKRNKKKIYASFVFVGAGGGALPLLEKSKIEEGKGFGGFPVSGQWLKCNNPEVVERHNAKVYGKAAVGAPPMSVPHLDSRMIDGQKELLFGPYAGFTTRFLKEGSLLDLPSSIKLSNIVPMMQAGLQNIDLTKYLIEQVRQSPEDRLEALKEYFPNARMEDWELLVAGQRVQVIKKDPVKGGVLEFGTEIVAASDGSIAALLGASPGASTAVDIMLKLLERCFNEEYHTEEWQSKLKAMIPSFGQSLISNDELFNQINHWTNDVLGLKSAELA
ncbi:malate:quinone oxidoreductase [Flectobacillus rivi]|uniref:Probable malate:quinone oxidoreductase n=1 Tax=Flectobacillus rivi TaxID=2984209 RepID=A0ABT6YWI4_9BACT|nr:malate:quinone oxidoreductase [Flectobacillus rivi]MDI9873241.1 malate:quinone oxidoreductase [Flectobacillus rivi]